MPSANSFRGVLSSKLHNNLSAKARNALYCIESITGLPGVRVVYCVTSSGGDPYEAMTLVSLRTLRRTNPSARVTIVCDSCTHEALRVSGSPLLEEADAIRDVKTPEGTAGFRNRFLKTQLGLLIEGPFLFLDSDTVVRRSLFPLLWLRPDIAAAPNHSSDSFDEQVWDEDRAHLQKMGWQVKHPYLNSGVIWYRGTPASRNFSKIWHLSWLDGVKKTSRWRDQTSFNHALAQATTLRIHSLDHQWNAQYWANPTRAAGARIWHVYSSVGSIDKRLNELFFQACQQVLARAERGLSLDSASIEELVSHPSPFRS